MLYYDDGTKQAQTRANYEKLITVDKVNFIVGPFDDPQTITGARGCSAARDMAFLEGSGTSPDIFRNGLDNLFAVSLSATSYFTSFVHYVLSLPVDMRPETAAYATSDEGFTKSQIDSARRGLEKGGIRTALYTVYSAETTDLRPCPEGHCLRSGRRRPGHPWPTGQSGHMKNFKQQHYNPGIIASAAGPDQGQDFINGVGGVKNTEGMIVPNDGWWPAAKNYQNTEFVQFITTKYNITSDAISSDSVQAFSVGQVLQQALEKTQSLDNQKLIDELRPDTFQSLQGPVSV